MSTKILNGRRVQVDASELAALQTEWSENTRPRTEAELDAIADEEANRLLTDPRLVPIVLAVLDAVLRVDELNRANSPAPTIQQLRQRARQRARRYYRDGN